MKDIVLEENKYKSTPFLFLIASYVKNSSLNWAYENLEYVSSAETYSWIVYKFAY